MAEIIKPIELILAIGVKLSILHQIYLRINAYKENHNTSLNQEDIKHILIGSTLVAIKNETDDIDYMNIAFEDVWKMNVKQLNQIEREHLIACKYLVNLTGEKLYPILNQYAENADLLDVFAEIKRQVSVHHGEEVNDVENTLLSLLKSRKVVLTTIDAVREEKAVNKASDSPAVMLEHKSGGGLVGKPSSQISASNNYLRNLKDEKKSWQSFFTKEITFQLRNDVANKLINWLDGSTVTIKNYEIDTLVSGQLGRLFNEIKKTDWYSANSNKLLIDKKQAKSYHDMGRKI